MREVCKKLIACLLVLVSSIAVCAQDFPVIDAQRVQERLAKVNPSFLLKHRKDNKSLTSVSVREMKKPASNVKMEAAAAGAHVEGLQVFNLDEQYDTWWQFNPETVESTALWQNDMIGGYNFNAGFVKDGVIYAVTAENGYILKFDLATGVYQGYISLYDYDDLIIHAAYDKENDVVYCYTYDTTGEGMLFQMYDPEERTYQLVRTEVGEGTLAEDPLVAMAYNPLDKFLYGITLYGENWIKINPENGEWQVIKKLDFQPSGYVQAMVYLPSAFAFSYVAVDVNEAAHHLMIEPETGNITSQTRMLDEAEYAILYCPDDALAKDAPLAPVIVSSEFDPVALSGKVKVAVPDKTFDGTELTGTVKLVMTIDDAEYSTQEVAVGSEVELSIENQTEGAHSFSVYCVSATGTKGGVAEQEFWIGFDVPATPQNVVLTETLITWDSVTEGQYGQPLESDVITYNVYIDGQKINEEPIVTNSYELNLEYTELTKVRAEVEAVCGSKVSQRGVSNEVVVGSYSIPLELNITQDVLPLITVVDANNDNKTWKWNSSDNVFEYLYSSSNDADDWAILPKTKFAESNQLYTINLDVSCYSLYPEKFEVGISKTGKVEDMVIVVPETQVASDDVITLGGQFKLDEAGEYYIGIHAISDADCYYLRLTKVTATMAEAPKTVPAACAEIVATAAEYGELAATVEFTMPALDLNGETLESEKDITVSLVSNVETVTVTGKPGERVSGVVKTEQGTNIIKVVPENEYGVGVESSVTVYTGVDVPLPAKLTSVRVSEDNRTVTFSWETTTEGKNGGFVDPAFVTYKILIYYPEQNYWFLEADCETTEYSYTVEEGASLRTVSLAVTSLNAAGYMEEGPMVISSLGAPHEIPMVELFENQELTYAPLTIERPSEECSGSWDIVSPSAFVVGAANESAAALRGFATQDGNSFAQIALPKFNPQTNDEVMVKVRAYIYGGMPDAEVFARGYQDSYLLGTISKDGREEGWFEFEFVLPQEVKELQWAELVIKANFTPDTEYLLIDKYEISVFTGVESIIASETKIYATEDAIVVENANVGDEIRIFTPNGATIVVDKASKGQMKFDVNAGIYVVRCGNTIQKVNVR
ncbi:MAG: hypothetical protein E7082_02490 [Bacteroidales bacterium]|nr:hypothetical protein [Bacteroidales bacterium]